jgi:hypothetical protein
VPQQQRQLRIPFELVKVDDTRRIVTGWVAVVSDDAGNPIVDSDGHVIPATELEKAVQKAGASGGAGKLGDMHERKGIGDFVESMVITAEKRAALGLGEGRDGWAASLSINDDEAWQRIKAGERPELSMRGVGLGKRLASGAYQISDIELNSVEWASLVDKGASGSESARPSIVLWKRAIKDIAAQAPANEPDSPAEGKGKMDPTVELALDQLGLNAKQKEAVASMLQAAAAKPAAPAAEPPKPEEKPEGEMPEEIKKRFDAERAKVVELEKRCAESADKLLTMELTKRAAELVRVPASPAEIVDLLKMDVGGKIEAMLLKVNKAMETAPLLTPAGKPTQGTTESPIAELKKRAKAIKEASPKMKNAEAFKAACKQNPELYAETLKG